MVRRQVLLDGGVLVGFPVPQVEGHAFAFEIDADLLRGVAQLHLLPDMPVRDTVVMPVVGKLDMAVLHDCHLSRLPYFKTFARQGF
ncbi:hypothetical protein SDC9_128409 [bioreactor metagenome]|uniref:Uncharacterized protein n=1 Tax=bioreactor metagenome TaxID=1076179 RepID=A0A645CW46_9ZZZZ